MAGGANPKMVQTAGGTQMPLPTNPAMSSPTGAPTQGNAIFNNPVAQLPTTTRSPTGMRTQPAIPSGGMDMTNPYNQASAAQMGALSTYANPAARAQQMMNPYQQNVVNKTLRDVGSAAQMGMNTLDAQASQAGAFGGSRHGVAMAEAAKGYQQQALDAVGALNQQGYNQAMNDAFRAAQGMQSAGQQSFGYGQQIQNMQLQQGAMQQAAMQQLIDQARQQYQGYASAPTQKLQLPLQALGVVPYSTSSTTTGGAQTSSMNPGLFNYLQVGAQMFGGS